MPTNGKMLSRVQIVPSSRGRREEELLLNTKLLALVRGAEICHAYLKGMNAATKSMRLGSRILW
jgi:hypothetical protein